MKLSTAIIALAAAAAPAAANTEVNIAIKCNGIDFTTLSVSDDILVGHVLESAYNAVHGQTEGDDMELTDVSFGGSNSVLGATYGYGGYNGYVDCRLCPKTAIVALGVGATDLAWQAQVVIGLLETIPTGRLSVALESVTRPKVVVRPTRMMRASASTSKFTGRRKCMV